MYRHEQQTWSQMLNAKGAMNHDFGCRSAHYRFYRKCDFHVSHSMCRMHRRLLVALAHSTIRVRSCFQQTLSRFFMFVGSSPGVDMCSLPQAVSAVFNNYSLQLFWGLLVILFQRGQDLPAKVKTRSCGKNNAFSRLTLNVICGGRKPCGRITRTIFFFFRSWAYFKRLMQQRGCGKVAAIS